MQHCCETIYFIFDLNSIIIKELLRHKGMRATEFRLQILEIFETSDTAIDMAHIESHLGKFDRITLYRTIKSFLEKGIIHEIYFGASKKYALCNHSCESDHAHSHDHVHFHCTECAEVYCVEVENKPTIQLEAFQVKETEIQLKGVCAKCV